MVTKMKHPNAAYLRWGVVNIFLDFKIRLVRFYREANRVFVGILLEYRKTRNTDSGYWLISPLLNLQFQENFEFEELKIHNPNVQGHFAYP